MSVQAVSSFPVPVSGNIFLISFSINFFHCYTHPGSSIYTAGLDTYLRKVESVKEKYMEVDMVIQEENVIIVKLSLLSSSCLSGCCSCFKLFHIVTWGNFQSQF